MLLGMLSQLDSLVQSIRKLVAERRVAGLVDGVSLGPTVRPVVDGGRVGRLGGRLGLGGCGLASEDGRGDGAADEQEGHGGGLEHHLEVVGAA